MLSLRNAFVVPSTKHPIDGITLFSYILPPLLFHFIVAMLAVMPQTHVIRVALFPLVVLLVLRAVLSMDTSLTIGRTDLDFGLFFSLFVITRTLDWALVREPLVRRLRPANSSPSTIMDALDLLSNLRGLGWEWSHYQSYTPRETRPVHRIAFVIHALRSAVSHALMCDAVRRAVLTLAPEGTGPIPKGSTIFDETLPFLVCYFRACIISVLVNFAIYANAQMSYDMLAIPAILVLGQDPVQWPPPFDAPWRATSLTHFWGRRWHQWLRRSCLFLGGYPLSFVLGRSGIIIGSFLASAVAHHVAMLTFTDQADMWWMVVGFGMMGPGILAEWAFYRATGKKVGGIVGWVWTIAWLLSWGHLIVEGYARSGVFSSLNFVYAALPVRIPVEHLVTVFDAWLHTI